MNVCSSEANLQGAFFIAIVRNPYAQAEGIIRRNGATPEYAAKFALKCLRFQRDNYLLDMKNILFISYEDLCEKQVDVVKSIVNFIPDLEYIKIDSMFTAHNFKSNKAMKVQNLNNEKIKRLSDKQLKVMSNIFSEEPELLQFFNYKILN